MLSFLKNNIKWRVLVFELAKLDMVARYRRSFLGYWWNILSLTLMILSLVLVWSTLFKIDIEAYLLYFSCGYISWLFVSQTILDGANSLVASEGSIKTVPLPAELYITKAFVKNVMMFFTQIPLVFVLQLFVGAEFEILNVLIFIMNAFIVGFCLYGVSLIAAVLCLRFRDIGQLLPSIIQLVFFITPVLWDPSFLSGRKEWIVTFNPFASALELLRNPLLGKSVSMLSYSTVIGIGVVSILIGLLYFKVNRHKIAYWL